MEYHLQEPCYFSQRSVQEQIENMNTNKLEHWKFALTTNLHIILIEELYERYPEMQGFNIDVRRNKKHTKCELFLYNSDENYYQPDIAIQDKWESLLFNSFYDDSVSYVHKFLEEEKLMIFANTTRDKKNENYLAMLEILSKQDIFSRYCNYITNFLPDRIEIREAIKINDYSFDLFSYSTTQIIDNQKIIKEMQNFISKTTEHEELISYYKSIESLDCDHLYLKDKSPVFYSRGSECFSIKTGNKLNDIEKRNLVFLRSIDKGFKDKNIANMFRFLSFSDIKEILIKISIQKEQKLISEHIKINNKTGNKNRI